MIDSVTVGLDILDGMLIPVMALLLGVYAWRREFTGKRRIELTESALTLCLEVSDAIRAIRQDLIIYSEEPASDPQHSTGRWTKTLDRCERYESLFSKLRPTSYRMVAMFDEPTAEPLRELERVREEIWNAARSLERGYWGPERKEGESDGDYGRRQDKRAEFLSVIEAPEANDNVAERVHDAVKCMQRTAQREQKAYANGMWWALGVAVAVVIILPVAVSWLAQDSNADTTKQHEASAP